MALQQVVEICKALSRDCSILVLDEPTAVLTGHETEKLFALVRRLRDQGVCIIYISHRLDEVFKRCATWVTVLKDSATVGTWDIATLDHDGLTRLMIGRELNDFFPPRTAEIGPVMLGGGADLAHAARRVLYRPQGRVLGIGVWSAPAGPRFCARSLAPTRSARARSRWTARRCRCAVRAMQCAPASGWSPRS